MTYEVIVVGGGIGGLTTAALLAARGVKVCLFERQSRVGGCVANFEHLGYEFEPTFGLYSGWEDGGLWARIFSELPSQPPAVTKLSPSYVVRMPDGRDIAVSDDRESFAAELARAFPDNAGAAIGFLESLQTSDHPNDTVASVLSGVLPDIRLFIAAQLQTFIQRTSAECSVSKAAAVFRTLRGALWNMKGGAQALADQLADGLKKSGGVLRLNSPVLRLAYDSDGAPVGVDLLSGERVLASRAIISNLTVWDTYGKLIGLGRTPKPISGELKKLRAWGAYQIFLGMDEGVAARLAAQRILLVKGVNDNGYSPDRQQMVINIAPTSDPRAPAGKRAVTVSTFTAAEDWFSFHEDETSHDSQDQAMLEECWARLHSAMPELGDSVEVIETATPRTMYETTRRKFGLVGSPRGLAEGPDSNQPLATTLFPNVFLVGDTVSSGIGLEGIARSACELANSLARRSS